VSGFRPVAIATVLAAAGAFLPPSVTHFADHGLSFALIITWFALLVFGLIRYRPAAWWLLLTMPIALFWPAIVVAVVASGDLYLGF
jgi:hypothetical protein